MRKICSRGFPKTNRVRAPTYDNVAEPASIALLGAGPAGRGIVRRAQKA